MTKRYKSRRGVEPRRLLIIKILLIAPRQGAVFTVFCRYVFSFIAKVQAVLRNFLPIRRRNPRAVRGE